MSLDPDLVDHLCIWLERLISPLLIRQPDVLACVDKQCGIDHLNKEVDLGRRAVGVAMMNVPNLCVLSQHMGYKSVKNGDIL